MQGIICKGKIGGFRKYSNRICDGIMGIM